MSNDIETILEQLINRHGLTHVVNTIAVICIKKAAHLREHWQDDTSAQVWEMDAATLTKAVENIQSDG